MVKCIVKPIKYEFIFTENYYMVNKYFSNVFLFTVSNIYGIKYIIHFAFNVR